MIKNELNYNIKSINPKIMDKIRSHPLDMEDIVKSVLLAWEGLLNSKIGNKPCLIGIDLFPKPQLIGNLLHELIPIEISLLFPEE